MGLSDTLRKNTYEEDFEGLELKWKKSLEEASTKKYFVGSDNIMCHADTVAGYLAFNSRYVNDIYISTSRLKIYRVDVPYYDSVREADSLKQASLFEVVGVEPDVHGAYEHGLLLIECITEGYKNVALNTILNKYKCFARGKNRVNDRCFSLFTNEEDAFKAAHIIKSCDDGGFKKYEVRVQKIVHPEYAETYVSRIIQPYKSAGLFSVVQRCKYEVAHRTFGKMTGYAIFVDIRW